MKPQKRRREKKKKYKNTFCLFFFSFFTSHARNCDFDSILLPIFQLHIICISWHIMKSAKKLTTWNNILITFPFAMRAFENLRKFFINMVLNLTTLQIQTNLFLSLFLLFILLLVSSYHRHHHHPHPLHRIHIIPLIKLNINCFL